MHYETEAEIRASERERKAREQANETLGNFLSSLASWEAKRKPEPAAQWLARVLERKAPKTGAQSEMQRPTWAYKGLIGADMDDHVTEIAAATADRLMVLSAFLREQGLMSPEFEALVACRSILHRQLRESRQPKDKTD